MKTANAEDGLRVIFVCKHCRENFGDPDKRYWIDFAQPVRRHLLLRHGIDHGQIGQLNDHLTAVWK